MKRRALPALVALGAYLVVAPLAGFFDQPDLKLLAMGLLLAPLIFATVSNRIVAALLAVATIGALGILFPVTAPQIAIFAPPVVINCALAWTFGSTLAADRIPLITVLVEKMHAGMDFPDPTVWHYTRAITGYWTLLFVANALIGLVLALLVTPTGLLSIFGIELPYGIPLAWWSLHAYVGCYATCALFFVIEFAYRRRRFPWQPYNSLADFLRSLAALARTPDTIHSLTGRPQPRD